MKGFFGKLKPIDLALLGGLFLVFVSSLVLAGVYPRAIGFFLSFAAILLLLGSGFAYVRFFYRGSKGFLANNSSKSALFWQKTLTKENLWPFVKKVLAVLLFLLYLAHYEGGKDYFSTVDGLSSSSFMAPSSVFFGMVGILLFQAAAMLAAVSSFVPSPFFRNVRKWGLTSLSFLSFALSPFLIQGIAGDVLGSGEVNFDPYSFRLPLLGIELGILFVLSASSFFEEGRSGHGPKFVTPYLLLAAVVLLSLPSSYSFAVVFGSHVSFIPVPEDLNVTHRVLVYLAFLLPTAYFFLLRPFDAAHRHALLAYVSYMAFYGYIGGLRWNIWTSLETIPLHLCCTAMYVIPLVLTFKTTKVFYFTMFVNVIGAFIALLMPNYVDSAAFPTYGAFSLPVVEFYINHLYAFFMPVLIVLLGIYPRPKMKYFFYSMAGFLAYFLLCLVVNTVGNAYGYDIDFFFLYSDYVPSQIGDWAKKIYELSFAFSLGGKEFVVHPLYLVCFYFVYVGFAFAMWYVYELLFAGVDGLELLLERSGLAKRRKEEWKRLLGKEHPMEERATLKIEHLRKRYPHNDFDTVRDFSLELEGGKIYAFLGKNGAGKSTIIKSIVGMHDFDGGRILVSGHDLQEEEIAAKSLIGFVPDHYALYESLTGREYVNYIADLYGVSKADREERLSSLLPRLSLVAAFDRPIGTYSHGMKQKITIVSSLVHDPKVWILDEPMTGVDPVSIFEIKETMREHARKGNIVFFSTHLIDVVNSLCDEIIVIRHGDLVYRGEVSKLHEEGVDLEQLFLKLGEDPKGEAKP